MSNSKTSEQATDINTMEMWSQTFKLFGKPLELILTAVLNENGPPMYLLTTRCEGVTGHFWVSTRQDSRFNFVVDGTPLKGMSAAISFSNWQAGELAETAHLQITGYQLLIENVANETIFLRDI